MSEIPNQISRREILKRGAFVGGAVVWATPVVQTLGMGRAFAATPSDTCVGSYADQVISYTDPVGHKDPAYDPIASERRILLNALGGPTYPPNEKFFSLGWGGEIVVKLGLPYFSGKKGEALVVETTFTAPSDHEERAKISVAQNPFGPFTELPGYATNKTSTTPVTTKFYLDGNIPGPPYVVRYVRVKDITAEVPNSPGNSDGFDVNSIGISCPTDPQ